MHHGVRSIKVTGIRSATVWLRNIPHHPVSADKYVVF